MYKIGNQTVVRYGLYCPKFSISDNSPRRKTVHLADETIGKGKVERMHLEEIKNYMSMFNQLRRINLDEFQLVTQAI